ncbi:MAG TPA: DUF2812 domain-containing protein [Candidatus Evtepia faecigallinarum]|nr:DUF2812 domain-containing protein [Candidatus Evtepia faecigallinarum]
MKEKTRRRRLIPCAAYDVEAMESWLGDQAAEGWFLEEEGIVGPWACFVSGPPRRTAYRLTSSLSAPELIGPDEEARDLSAAYGWKYLAKRKEFYIYRATGEHWGEMDTDPRTQALILRAVRRRTIGTVITLLVMGLGYPLFLLAKDGQLGLLVRYPWYWMLPFAFVVWFLTCALAGSRHYHRLARQLEEGRPLDHRKPWQPQARRHLACALISVLLTGMVAVQVVLVLVFTTPF